MELEILRQLEAAHPRLMKQTVLQAAVSLAVDGFTKTAFERGLVLLEEKKQIRIQAGEDVTRIAITADGLNRVADAR